MRKKERGSRFVAAFFVKIRGIVYNEISFLLGGIKWKIENGKFFS